MDFNIYYKDFNMLWNKVWVKLTQTCIASNTWFVCFGLSVMILLSSSRHTWPCCGLNSAAAAPWPDTLGERNLGGQTRNATVGWTVRPQLDRQSGHSWPPAQLWDCSGVCRWVRTNWWYLFCTCDTCFWVIHGQMRPVSLLTTLLVTVIALDAKEHFKIEVLYITFVIKAFRCYCRVVCSHFALSCSIWCHSYICAIHIPAGLF